MTKDEIIRMAREANDYANKVCRQDTIPREWRLVRDVRFAALVSAHEREKQAEQEPDDLDWITPEAVFEAKLKLHGIPNPPVREKNK